MTETVAPETLALQRMYHWETDHARQCGADAAVWRRAVARLHLAPDCRRIAAHGRPSEGRKARPPGRGSAFSARTAPDWIMADLAIWMAGHVSVPLYPRCRPTMSGRSPSTASLSPVRRQARSVGMTCAPVCPTACRWISLPLAPVEPTARPGTTSLPRRRRSQGNPLRDGNELATIIYTSGTTGSAEGGDAQFRDLRTVRSAPHGQAARDFPGTTAHLELLAAGPRRGTHAGSTRARSTSGMHVYFAESLDSFARTCDGHARRCSFPCRACW